MSRSTAPSPMGVNRVIQSFYAKIHGHYDRVNSGITFGMDQYWRRCLLGECRRLLPDGALIIDLCTGTGKTARELIAGGGEKAFRVIGADFSLEMLKQGRDQGTILPWTHGAVASDARFLPFADSSVSAVTISFATRNLDARPGDFDAVLKEVWRVLIPGGVFTQIETAQPANRFIRWLYHRFVAIWVPLVSGIFSTDRRSYRFLLRSIQTFDSPHGLQKRLEAGGFTVNRVKPFFLGASCLLTVIKTEKTAL